ncbi:MAG: hypothetical protein COT92_00810 [Candidatus Doudnabacteria bacterium CG10_big_fil_rev_8_21_14_0_10_42_18]|uniref:Transcriptional repressor n=1 Tax=Candidatus Doudnabacteria bacterium CG10_big_fil_rev_8_21_14_0_10_42_18 TaxID=1974552 RepID=A0A2H0VBM4_9BACT|nr:MAG: hypothetical protein COT92_00810 [Candidatus Doudnabacteria bacterium CG10_big_fil_rev_8_21_14_0_10_42_18]
MKICIRHEIQNIAKLRSHKLKVTPIRLELLDILEHAREPVSVKTIKQSLKVSGADIASIYRNLEALKKLGVVLQVQLEKGEGFYELSGRDHHHHVICENCGKVCDVPKFHPKTMEENALKASGFARINRHSLEFFGLCKNCLNKK